MDLNSWLAFCTAAFALTVVPGPTILLVITYALSQGRSVALACVSGVALGDFLAMTVSLAGLGAVLLASATLFTLLKWLGAAYLVWMGLGLLRSAASPPEEASTGAGLPPGKVFRNAALVTALNPKGIVFFLAFVPQFLDPQVPVVPQFTILIASFVAIGSANALIYALLAARLHRQFAKPGLRRTFNRLGGSILILFGVLTAASKRAV